MICDRALLGAYTQDKIIITQKIVKNACKEVLGNLKNTQSKLSLFTNKRYILIIFASLITIWFFFFGDFLSTFLYNLFNSFKFKCYSLILLGLVMSFILDAIKKSEKERRLAKQNEIHSFQDEVIKTPRSKKSLFILKAFLIFSFILFIFFVYFFSVEIKSFYSDISNKYHDGLKAEDVTLTKSIKDKITTEQGL